MSQLPKKDKQDLADALASFAAGEHAEEPVSGSGMEGQAGAPQRSTPLPKQGPLPSAQPARPTDPSEPGVRPPALKPPTPVGGARVPVSPPVRASTPDEALGEAPRRSEFYVVNDAPADRAPPAISHEREIALEAEAVARVIEDDDTLNLPAPAAEQIIHRPPPRPRQRPALSRTVGFKQTLIPILLTLGVLLPGIAGWSFAMGEESPIAGEVWIPLALIGIGVVMLVFGVITMVLVRHQLKGNPAR